MVYWNEDLFVSAHQRDEVSQWSRDWVFYQHDDAMFIAYGQFDLYGFDRETVQEMWLEYEQVVYSFPG